MEAVVEIEDPTRRDALYGPADRNLRLVRAAFDVRISARNGELRLSGPDESVTRATRCLEDLQRILRTHPVITDELLKESVDRARAVAGAAGDSAGGVYLDAARIVPKTEGQAAYINAIDNSDLTICLGPAGTGKTYLAVAMALSLLKRGRIKRIVLVRPAVEAGEKLGYLPGDMQAKVNPYLRPLFDAMNDMMNYDHIRRFLHNDVIEVIPLAFMRGRTLNQAVIILDEAQNATQMQMLMFLTRLGQNSKMIVTGDDSQSDLADSDKSGLVDAIRRLENVTGVSVVRLGHTDIVRHVLVQRVVQAYGDRTKNV